jgi:photosystem II stability/assembly factor-like uncharacterized protein
MKNRVYPMFTHLTIAAALTGLISTGWSQSNSQIGEARALPKCDGLVSHNTLYDVAFIPGKLSNHWVAVGRQGTILTSVDGKVWQPRDSGTEVNLRSVAAGGPKNPVVVAVGERGTITFSPNAANCWEKQDTGTDARARLLDVAYGNGLFVAVGDYGTILTSANGRQWQRQNSVGSGNLCNVAYGAGKWLVTGRAKTLLISEDAKNWKSVRTGIAAACYGPVAYAHDSFVMTFSQCGIIRSGKDWTWEREHIGQNARLKSITAGDKTLVAVGKSGVILTSICRGYWEKCESPTSSLLHNVAVGDDNFVAVGARGTILRSEDGLHWNSTDSAILAAHSR